MVLFNKSHPWINKRAYRVFLVFVWFGDCHIKKSKSFHIQLSQKGPSGKQRFMVASLFSHLTKHQIFKVWDTPYKSYRRNVTVVSVTLFFISPDQTRPVVRLSSFLVLSQGLRACCLWPPSPRLVTQIETDTLRTSTKHGMQAHI